LWRNQSLALRNSRLKGGCSQDWLPHNCNAVKREKVPGAEKELCQHEFMPEPLYTRDEPPPFLRSWRRIYVAVLIYLAAVIFAFYLFTRAYR
jgi:hypothetical protein